MPLRRLTPLLVLALACGGTSARLEPRFIAVHNAMSATGYAQTGPISEGSLDTGGAAEFELELPGGQCATVVALGSSGVEDLELVVTSPDGEEELGRDVTHDRHAAAQVCPSRSGSVRVVLTMAEGAGGYVVSSWSGASTSSGPRLASGPTSGTCSEPIPLAMDTPVTGDTTGRPDSLQPVCVGSSRSPDVVHVLEIPERIAVDLHLSSAFDGVLYLMRQCGAIDSTIDCNDDDPDTSNSRIRQILDPGTYYVVVDGFGEAAGAYTLTASATQLRPVADICSSAQTVAVGQTVSGDTSGGYDYFQATCAGGARSPDNVYRVAIPTRSRVRVRQQSSFDGALYLRSSCTDPNSEIVCNDDFMGTSASLVTAIVDPGTYFIYADGYLDNHSGQYDFRVDLGSPQGGQATSDSCTGIETVTPGQSVSLDTLQAADDFTASCGGAGAADVVYRLQLASRSRVDIDVVGAEFSPILSIRSACDNAQSEILCEQMEAGIQQVRAMPVAPVVPPGMSPNNPGAGTPPGTPPGRTPGRVTRELDAGTYFIVLDAARPDVFGGADLNVTVTDLAALRRECTRAPVLRPGRTTRGTTRGATRQFGASCAGGAGSPDTVYRIRLNRRSRVRVRMDSTMGTGFDGALHIRRDCADAGSELACNDDTQDNRHSEIETTLDRGTYFLIVDGFSENSEGEFEIDFEVSRP